ncbi:MAG TPA: hypothetical protein PKM16_11245, partial [Bacteroidia bacterium]|nr:hypothetical protein [Bacteroidia bacterium]
LKTQKLIHYFWLVVQQAQCVYASCRYRVNLKLSFCITFRHVGQDAASKAAAVINTGRCAS